MTYPQSRRVVLGLCPPRGWPETPTFGDQPSVSATRMESTMPGWRRHFLGANLWWTHEAWDRDEPHHLSEVLWQTKCRTVVALGREVQRELGITRGELLSTQRVRVDGIPLDVLLFPHPSGLCRTWNEPAARTAAAAALVRSLTPAGEIGESMRRHPSCTG